MKEFEGSIKDFKSLSTSQDEDDENPGGTLFLAKLVFLKKNVKSNKLIVMVDVLSLANGSKGFAAFLTVTRKFQYSCVYNFDTIYPEKGIWKLIFSQT